MKKYLFLALLPAKNRCSMIRWTQIWDLWFQALVQNLQLSFGKVSKVTFINKMDIKILPYVLGGTELEDNSSLYLLNSSLVSSQSLTARKALAMLQHFYSPRHISPQTQVTIIYYKPSYWNTCTWNRRYKDTVTGPSIQWQFCVSMGWDYLWQHLWYCSLLWERSKSHTLLREKQGLPNK